MKNQNYHEEYYYLRFVDISEQQVQLFKLKFLDTEIDQIKKREKTNDYVASIKLTQETNLDKITDFIKSTAIPESNFGIWVSLFSNNDHDGVSVPLLVLNIYKQIGGSIDFSFVFFDE
jgi:hypothetical protein